MKLWLRLDNWLQLFLVIGIIILINSLSAQYFFRVDLTKDNLHSLELSTRALVWKLDKPLYAKVYFTGNLQNPYNNHETIVLEKLEELQAYSKGWLKIERLDPTNRKELEAQAKGFGIDPINYSYKSRTSKELKKVFMGVALVYGDRQEAIPAITRVETLEYDIARALRRLISEEQEKSIIGLTTGHGEPDIIGGQGPLEALRLRLEENYTLKTVTLGTDEEVPDDVDILWVVGPQRAFTVRALYQLDQFIMQGGAAGIFLSGTKPNLRTLQAEPIYHGLEGLLAHYGIQVNRDVIVDRVHNGEMAFPVRQGKLVRQVQISYPLIPRANDIKKDLPVMRGLESMLVPFVSSVELQDPLPVQVEGEVWASSSKESGKIVGLLTINPQAFLQRALGEMIGSYPVLVQLNGTWTSFFADKTPPNPNDIAKITQGAPARIVVGGSADMVANNLPFMLNLADWLVEDEALINIRSKIIQLPKMEAAEEGTEQRYKLFNLLTGSILILLFGGIRMIIRKRSGGMS